MNKLTFTSVAVILLLVACHQPTPQEESFQPLPIHMLKGKSCFEIKALEALTLLNDVYLDVENEFTLAWPDLSGFSPQVRAELSLMAFGDSNSTSLQEAGKHFLSRTWVEDDDLFPQGSAIQRRKLDSVRFLPHNYVTVNGEVRQDRNLLHFSVNYEHNVAFAAHGTYGYRTLIVDRATDRIVCLCDLMDTTGLGLLLLRALDEVPSNRENGNTAECIDGEYQHRLPPPDGFTIDSNRTTITAFYNIYSVQCYGCGMLFVEMPVAWLDANATLTPYGKEIFAEALSHKQ